MSLNFRRGSLLKPTFSESRINWSHPLARGLVGAWLFNEFAGATAGNLVVPDDAFSLVGSGFWAFGNGGIQTGYDFGNSAYGLLSNPTAKLKPANEASIFWRGAIESNAFAIPNLVNNPALIQMAYTNSNTSPFYALAINRINPVAAGGSTQGLYWLDDAGGTSQAQQVNTAFAFDQLFSAGITFKNGGNCVGYKDGIQQVSSARSGVLTYASPRLSVNCDLALAGSADAIPEVIYYWDRQLSKDESFWIAMEPYALIASRAPLLKKYFVLPSQTISPSGIVTAEAFGSHSMNVQKKLSLTGIASGEAFGSPGISPQTAKPNGIASSEAFGTLSLNFSQAILPGGVPSAEAFGMANVAGQQFVSPGGIASAEAVPKPIIGTETLTPDGIASVEAFGIPSLNVEQRILPGGIPSAEVVSTGLAVSLTQSIIPSGIASAEAFGTANVVGSPKKLNIPGIAPGEAFGFPLVSTPGGGLRIFIAGADCTHFFQPAASGSNVPRKAGLLRRGASGSSSSTAGSAQPVTFNSQTIGRSTATFDFIDYDGTFAPEMGQTVLITEPGFRHFAGCLTSVQFELIEKTNAVIIHSVARDKSAICDRRVVKTVSYPAGMDIADVFRDINANSLSGEGVTTNGLPASLGALLQDFTLPGQLPSVTQAYDALVLLFGGVWWIDSYCDLHAGLPSSLPASPFIVDKTNTRGISVTTDSKNFATKVYAISDRVVQPGGSGGPPQPPGISVTETFTLPQQASVDRGFLFGSIITEFSILAITSLKVNGVSQAVYLGTDPFNFRHAWWFFPQTPYIIPPNAQNTNPFPDPPTSSADPTMGDVVEVQYISQQPTAQVQAGDPLSPTGGTCGSGIWEKVVQVQNVIYQDDLDTVAAAELLLYGQVPKLLSLETDIPGLAVGQQLTANYPRLRLSNAVLLVTSINAVSQGGVDIGHGSCFRWSVQAYNTADPGNDLKFWERVIQRSQMASPVTKQILPTATLAPGSSLGGGTVTDFAPLIVADTAQLIEIAVACNVGPVDQDMYIDLIDSASGSLLSTPLKVPAGTAANVVLTFTQVRVLNGTWVFQNETVQPTISYVQAGPTPQAASGVTVQCRGSF